MKYLLAFLSGFFVTVVVFVSGAAVTIVYLTAEPVPVRRFNTATSEPLANENVRVVDANPDSPTLVSQSGPESSGTSTEAQSPSDGHENKIDPEQAIDPVMTASATPEPTPQAAPEVVAAHIAWCSERYRSYDREDNRYNAYSGGRRECVSPYSKIIDQSEFPEQVTSTMGASAEGPFATADEPIASQAQNVYLDPEHVRSCFARYRSYRPEDNTYQPYGGGSRRQCE